MDYSDYNFGRFESNFDKGANGIFEPGSNGLEGFKQWECYMLIKYGKPGNFGLSGNREYLIEMPLYPDEVTEQISAQWTQQSVIGRSSPLSAYVNTSLKSVQFSLTLHRDLLTGSFGHDQVTLKAAGGNEQYGQVAGRQAQTAKGPFGTRSWYTSMNKMLQISCYPQYIEAGLVPPTTYFIFGQMILKGYVNSYSTTWKKPILNTFYGNNTVNIDMACYPDSIISAEDIITNKQIGTASTQNTYNTLFPDSSVEASNVMARYSTLERSNARSVGNND